MHPIKIVKKGMYIGTYVAYKYYGCFLNADSKYGGCYDYFHGSIYCVKKSSSLPKKEVALCVFKVCGPRNALLGARDVDRT